MGSDRAGEAITELLKRHHSGDQAAFDELVSLVYPFLHRIAQGQLAGAWPSRTLGTTGLVHEAYVQLRRETGVEWQDRAHFFAICARAMRRILVDYSRRHSAKKRGGGRRPLTLDGIDVGVDAQADLVLAVDEALNALEGFNERLARVVECRYFAGMTAEETSEALQTSVRTVERDWTRARAWLLKKLRSIPAP